MEVTWKTFNLEQLVPPVVQLIQSTGILSALSAYATAQQALITATSTKFIPDVASAANTASTAATSFLTLVDNAINDFYASGYYLLEVPPVRGGLGAFSGYIRSALLNLRDARRPDFSAQATIACVGGFAFSIDNTVVDIAFEGIKKATTPKNEIKRALNLEDFKKLEGLPAAHYKNLLAGTSKPIPDSPWISIRLADFIPGMDELLQRLKSLLETMKATAGTSAISNYASFATRQANNLSSLISQIQAVITFINDSLENIPLRLFAVPPSLGGTQELADEFPGFFDRSKHTEISDVQGNNFMTGFILVLGSNVTPASVQANYSVLTSIFGV